MRGVSTLETHMSTNKLCRYTRLDRKKPPSPGGFPIYYVPSSRTVCKRTPLEEPGENPSRGVLSHSSHTAPSSDCPGLRVLQKFNKQETSFRDLELVPRETEVGCGG